MIYFVQNDERTDAEATANSTEGHVDRSPERNDHANRRSTLSIYQKTKPQRTVAP